MAASTTPTHPGRLALPVEPGRRAAALSLLMLAGTVAAGVAAGVMGTLLQHVVFGLEDDELLTEAGAWGSVAAIGLLILMLVPAAAGIVLGVRARSLGERGRGLTGILLNAAVAAYLVVSVGATLLLG